MTTSGLVLKLSIATGAAFLITAGTDRSAEAAAVGFRGTLLNGVTQNDTVLPGENTDNPAGWSFWRFFGNAGDTTTLTVRRLVGELDPAFGVWFGTEADTSNYSSLFDDGLTTSLIASADDELPAAIAGPFGDPEETFTLDQTGFYTVAVSSFASDLTSGPLPYSITLSGVGATPVPTPALLPGLIGLGLGVLRKRKAEVAKGSTES